MTASAVLNDDGCTFTVETDLGTIYVSFLNEERDGVLEDSTLFGATSKPGTPGAITVRSTLYSVFARDYDWLDRSHVDAICRISRVGDDRAVTEAAEYTISAMMDVAFLAVKKHPDYHVAHDRQYRQDASSCIAALEKSVAEAEAALKLHAFDVDAFTRAMRTLIDRRGGVPTPSGVG